MRKNLGILVFAISVFLLSGNALAGPNIKEGLWEMTMTMDIPGMSMQMPPQTYTHCITKNDMVPQKKEPNQECKVLKTDVKGDTVSWVIECKTSEGTSVSNGRITYKGDTFDGVIKMSIPEGRRGSMEVTQKMKGKWIGQCR